MKESLMPETLPDDPAQLKTLLLETTKKLSDKERALSILEDKYKLLLHEVYGRRSEKRKLPPEEFDQELFLFNEAELGVTELEEEVLEFEEEEKRVFEAEKEALEEHKVRKAQKTKEKKRRGGKVAFPAHLPRRIRVHDIPEKEKEGRRRIGEDVTEELDCEINYFVVRNIYPIYGEKKGGNDGDKAVVSAARPKRLLKGAQYSDRIIAKTLVDKFHMAIPFYRQEQLYEKRYGFRLPRSRMCYWNIELGRALERLRTLMEEDIRGGPLIQMDETTLQVLKEPGRSVATKSFMWVMVGTTKEYRKIILFNYFQNRSGKVPYLLLEDYKGYLQTDGYKVYDGVAAARLFIVHCACWVHVRREFDKAERLSKKGKSEKVALSFIRQIFLAEDKFRALLEAGKLSEEEFVRQRKAAVEPILKKFKKWLDGKKLHVTPSSRLGKAIAYTLGQWSKLTTYLDSPYITPDNNLCENAIRPFVIGRKNWLFFDNPKGAYASATLYSLTETAKANGLDPYLCMLYILKNLPLAKTDDELRKLLPYNLTAEDIADTAE